MRKSVFCAFFLILLLSSCSPACRQWKLAVIKACCPSTSYVKIYLPACNSFNGLEAELMCSNGDIQLYLNALTLILPAEECDPTHTRVDVTIRDEVQFFMAEHLLGSQRLLMPEDARELIICTLLEGMDVEIRVGRYETCLIAAGFGTQYDKLISCCFP